VRRDEGLSTGESDVHYEIVCGERRYRASKAAQLAELPVIVRVLTDNEVIELQLIENLQREDVSVYEEAVGYASLLKLTGPDGDPLYTVPRIAGQIGKSIPYVRNRLKAKLAPKQLLAALERGEVGTRVCELVGRIPHEEDREKCAAEVLEPNWDDRPMTSREVEEHIAENYMIKLSRAPFDREDPELLEGVGACSACPHRSGNDESLQEDLQVGLEASGKGGSKSGVDPHLCLNPRCFREKSEAHYEQLQAEAPGKVLSEKQAKSCFEQFGAVKHNSAYVPLERTTGFAETGNYDPKKQKPWGALAAAAGVEPVTAKNPYTGEVMQLIPKAEVMKAEWEKAELAGKKSFFAEAPTPASKPVDPEEKRKEQERQKLINETHREELRRGLDSLSAALVGKVDKSVALAVLENVLYLSDETEMLRWMDLSAEASSPSIGVTEVDRIEAIVSHAGLSKYSLQDVLVLVAVASIGPAYGWNGLSASGFQRLSRLAELDIPALKREASKAVKEREKPVKKTAKKKVPAHKKAIAGSAEGAPDEWISNPNRGINEQRLVKLVEAYDAAPYGTPFDLQTVLRVCPSVHDDGHAGRILAEAKRRGLINEAGIAPGPAKGGES
jgi:ParB/RepB/Spo0J family partition protein